MSQIIVDEQLGRTEVLLPLRRWITARKIESFRPFEVIKDDRFTNIISHKIAHLTFVLLVSLIFVGSSFAAGEITKGRGIVYPSFVETPGGTLHCAYAEGLELKYAVSTDNGYFFTEVN